MVKAFLGQELSMMSFSYWGFREALGIARHLLSLPQLSSCLFYKPRRTLRSKTAPRRHRSLQDMPAELLPTGIPFWAPSSERRKLGCVRPCHFRQHADALRWCHQPPELRDVRYPQPNSSWSWKYDSPGRNTERQAEPMWLCQIKKNKGWKTVSIDMLMNFELGRKRNPDFRWNCYQMLSDRVYSTFPTTSRHPSWESTELW